MQKEITITVYGRPASKKNSRVNLPDGRSFPSSSYRKFLNSAIEQFKSYRGPRFENKLVKIDYTFYQKGGYEQDFDNAITSINDMLQHEKIMIFNNDKQIKGGSFNVVPKAKEWKTVLKIYEISSSYYLIFSDATKDM